MGNDVKRNVIINTEVRGLDEAKKQMESLNENAVLSLDPKENKKLLKERELIMKEISALESAEGMDEEEKTKRIAALWSTIDGHARSAAREIIQGMGSAAEGFKQDIIEAVDELIRAEDELGKAQKETKTFEKKFDMGLEGDTVDPKTNEANYELIEAGRKSLEKHNKITKELTLENKSRQYSAKTLLKHEESINKILKEKGANLDEEIEKYKKTGEISTELQESLNEYNKGQKRTIEDTKLLGMLKATNLAREEGKRLKIAEYNTLQTKETNKQANLQVRLNVLLDERKNLLQALQNENLTEEEAEGYRKSLETLDPLIKSAKEKLNVDKDLNQRQKDLDKSGKNLNKTMQRQGSTFGKAANQVFNYGIAFTALRRIYRETLRTIRDLDKALTEMAVVTTMNRKEAWQLTGQMSALARETGFTIAEISKLSTVYFRQGRVLSEVVELTRVSAMAARIAGISAAESADFLTSAVNAFQFSANQALAVSDRFAALAAQSASSYEELAVGLSKFAAQANVAGVSIDFAMGMLAKGIETTREAPETIGTALKTVIARMRELTDLGKTFEDGMDISRVETALRQVGIALRDEQGQFRDLELVLTEIGMAWENYDRNQQAAIAVALAGTRQQSRLIAIMQDFDRTLELVNISQDSAGATAAQHVQFMQGLEGATIRMQNAYQEFITTIADSDMLINIVNGLTTIITGLSNGLEALNFTGRAVMQTLIAFALVLKLGTVSTKLYGKAVAYKTAVEKSSVAITKLSTIQQWKYNTVTAIATATEKLKTAATLKQTLAIKAQIVVLKIWNAILFANPLILVAAAIAIAVYAVGRFTTATERNTKALQENRKELQASNYESRRTVRSIQNITKEMEKFNNMPFLTPAQREELETLNSQLEELYGEENQRFIAARLTDGSIDLELQARLNLLAIEEEITKQYENRLDIAKSLVEELKTLERVDPVIPIFSKENLKRTLKMFFGAEAKDVIPLWEEAFTKTPDLATINEFGNLFIAELDILFDNKLTPEAEQIFRRFLETFDFSLAADIGDDLSGFVRDNFQETMQLFEDFSEQVSGDSPLTERFRNFVEFFEDNEIDRDLEELLKRRIQPGLNFLQSISEDDIDGIISTLNTLNLTSDAQIQELAVIFGDDFAEVVNLVASEIQRLQTVEGGGLTALQAQEIAWSSLIGTIDDSAKAMRIHRFIFTESFSDMANSLALFDSRLQRTRDIQSQWMEGTVAVQDLARFFEENPGLFQSMEDVNRFLSGESLTDSIFLERLEEEQKALSRLFDAQRRLDELEQQQNLDEDTRQARRSSILAEIAAYRALTEFRGPLTQMTQTQFEYNAELERYNRLAEIGAETTEDFQRVLQSQANLFTETARKIDSNLENIEERFSRRAFEFGFGSEQITDFFDIVGGKIIPITENLQGLGASSFEFFTQLMDEYQASLDEAFDSFEERRKFELDNEKKLLDKQKQVYEDYFAALDRLEQRRERSRSRDDMVAQLRRLEGATDERSRRRALEIRRELNQLDEDDSRTMIQDARQALLQTFETAYEELEEAWARMTRDFIDLLDGRGGDSPGTTIGNHFAEIVNEEVDLDFEVNVGVGTEELENTVDSLETTLSNFVSDLRDIFILRPQAEAEEEFRRRREELRSNFDTGREEQDVWEEMMDSLWAEIAQNFGIAAKPRPFRKGGMVDYTGLAMLHGSKSSPEAVLSPAQTEMFVGLRDALQGLSFDSMGGGSVNIENISISTASLNNNQDFKRAGETLADAFKHAIQRKGVTINTNRT